MTGSPWYQRFDHAPPSLEDFERIGEEVLASLPAPFAGHVRDVPIRVEDFPDAGTEQMMALDSPYDLLGLYHGVPIGHDSALDAPRQDVDMIFLYRQPLLAYWCDSDESLAAIIRNTLIHEIGHHFGLSDDDMDRIEFGDPAGGDDLA
jgi:predicted Zn-dependent protease with MMP-like domain